MEEYLFVEKYAPRSVDQCILPPEIKKAFTQFRDTGNIPNLILTSAPGMGKTSSIKALVRDLGMDLLFVNGSNEGRYLDTIRDKVVQFCSSVSMLNDSPKKKCVLIDEFDNTLDSVQLCLRGVIEEFQSNVIFVFTVNNYSKILPAILSRCSTIEYVISKEEKKQMMIDVYKRLAFILAEENITFEKPVLISLVKNLFPDIRKIFNEVQRHSVGGVLNGYSLNIVTNDKISDLVDLMRNKKFEQIRIWVGTHNNHLTNSYRLLYDALRLVLEDAGLAQSIITIADYQHKANFAVDQEINFLAMVVTISYDTDIRWK
jgi:DNA polymerase III delta prime subunit